MRLFASFCAGALALALSSGAVFAQTATTISVKDGNGNPVSISGQQDAAGHFHYRDVLEGLTPTGAPQALSVDGTDSGLWAHITNFPSSFGISGALPAFASTPAFTISGALPAFAATPTVNLGTLNGAATATNQTAVQSAPGASAASAVTVQGNASGTPLPVSGSVTISNFPATQPVSANALPLPAGAATATNQTAVQSAPGSSASTATTIQGSASGVPVPVSGALATAGGWKAKTLTALQTFATAQNVKTGATWMGTVKCWSSNTTQVWLQVYDATSPTLGSPTFAVPLSPQTSDGLPPSNPGIQISNAINVLVTTTPTGTTQPTAEVDCTFLYN
jgi:hypothetical protein